ncbi:MAG: hypothetical protein LBD21_09160 [Tannerellaceae bacterium]|jgi:hypothetical protein|nr:hypothetical protein [Tannerellaceae bacterium]
MKQHYHQENNKQEHDGNQKTQRAKLGPCKQTLILLSQFARVYHVEPELKKPLCGFILN